MDTMTQITEVTPLLSPSGLSQPRFSVSEPQGPRAPPTRSSSLPRPADSGPWGSGGRTSGAEALLHGGRPRPWGCKGRVGAHAETGRISWVMALQWGAQGCGQIVFVTKGESCLQESLGGGLLGRQGFPRSPELPGPRAVWNSRRTFSVNFRGPCHLCALRTLERPDKSGRGIQGEVGVTRLGKVGAGGGVHARAVRRPQPSGAQTR